MESSDNEEYTIENSGEQYLPSSTMLKNIREAGPINPAKNTLSGLMQKLDTVSTNIPTTQLRSMSRNSGSERNNSSARAIEAKANFLNSIGSGPWPS
jgi:hypothetical protein